MTVGVYMIQSKATGKMYVGSSTSIEYRLGQHESNLKVGRWHQEFVDEYAANGAEGFEIQILETCDDASELLPAEQKWISHYNATEAGFNRKSAFGTKSRDGMHHLATWVPEDDWEWLRQEAFDHKTTFAALTAEALKLLRRKRSK